MGMGFEIVDVTFTDPAFLALTDDERADVVRRLLADPVMAEFSRVSKRRGRRIFWRSFGVLLALFFGLDFVRREVPFSSTIYAVSVLGLSTLWAAGEVGLWVRWMKRESARRMQSLLRVELSRVRIKNRLPKD
ncbi:hypothetical protein J8F10_23555 [Gemmata sp. G18]|uniref:DUF3040 domain-containing protein n=1 Tax=Gemmata palustris TaxID=2822762 RepID=A0ABS5BWX1_9BACT|nr:hypothetical protein [Gemmata palustris]MBP3958236.1 hypothetical protein [Gemmata palustris]